jgi:uncharacterized membrane protein YjfL (UPF0719 family)
MVLSVVFSLLSEYHSWDYLQTGAFAAALRGRGRLMLLVLILVMEGRGSRLFNRAMITICNKNL